MQVTTHLLNYKDYYDYVSKLTVSVISAYPKA